MNILNDKKLEDISYELDDYFFELCEKNEMPFMQLAALVLARLCVIAEDIEESHLLDRLLKLSQDTMLARKIHHPESSDQVH